MTTEKKQFRIYDYLLQGKENAKTANEIARTLGYTGKWKSRDVTRQIERERKAGLPICATNSAEYRGYYIPNSELEFDEYLNSLEHRYNEIGKTLFALKEASLRCTENVC